MEFVETSIFTQRIVKLLTDEAYRDLQAVLAQGDLTPEQLKVLRAYVTGGVL